MSPLIEIIGKSLPEARQYCQQNNIENRVVEEDGTHYIITHDLHPDRLNFVVTKGRVVKITKG